MVKLTFIRQAEKDDKDVGLTVKMAERVFLLSKALSEKFGKPQFMYASKEYLSSLTAHVSNLAFFAERLLFYDALRTNAQKREIRAFFDFIFADASANKAKHIVVVCPANIFDYAFIQLPAFGNSVTICGEEWKNLLQGYNYSWSPLKLDKLSVKEANFVTEKIVNAVCDTSEVDLIQRTINEALDKYLS